MKEQSPNILILSGVLQCLENPYGMLDKLLKYKFQFIIIDRTPFILKGEDIIKIQKVPPHIYKASYPCWFFNFHKFEKYFIINNYKIIEIFDAIDGKSSWYEFKGLILEKEE